MSFALQFLHEKFSIQETYLVAFSYAFMASMGTFLGGLVIILIAQFQRKLKAQTLMGILQAFSAGVMAYITCFDLIPEAIEHIGSRETMLWLFLGVLIFGIIEAFVVPEEEKPSKRKNKNASLERTGWITFIAMGLHNLPEGLGVYLSTLSNQKLGLQLAIGIMLHNIPEGMAVAIPLYSGSRSAVQVLLWTLLNGLAEPLGVIIGGTLLNPYINQYLLSRCLAVVGGIMLCISIHELLPMAFQLSGKGKTSVAFFLGMLTCFTVLESVDHWFEHHHH